MSAFDRIYNFQKSKNSVLCVGLDTDLNKLPVKYDRNDVISLLEFNKAIIDITNHYACAYKLNFAFYEQYGTHGFEVLKSTIDYIGDSAYIIADAKRGDIGNTSSAYAKSCFDEFGADSITVAPYMGYDSVEPFLRHKDKMTFVLALTSNPGSNDFQRLEVDGKPIYMHVIEKCSNWGDKNHLGFVVGATHPKDLAEIRDIIPEHFLLIPGIGTQGGNVEQLLKSNGKAPCMINVSRDIIYAGFGDDYLNKVQEKAIYYKDEFNKYM